jgi:hypothetical protein
MKSIRKFFYKPNKNDLTKVSEKEYLDQFVNTRTKEEIEKTYQKAWESKNIEVENYWKRANYFWAFQVASFTGYVAILGSGDTYKNNPQILYFVICIGLVTSCAWTFINIGSKTWQRHWEIHIDMLEDKVTGPLYKTVTERKTFSVSKINEIVSRFFVLIWIIIGIKYFQEHLTLKCSEIKHIDILVTLTTVVTISFIGAMYFGYGRGRFGKRKVRLYKRRFEVM